MGDEAAVSVKLLASLRRMRNNLRIMRTSVLLQALFPRTRQEVLAATFTQPEKWWFLSELAEFIGKSPSSLQREVTALVHAGILEQRRDGVRVYFKALKQSPIYRELHGILEKTAGMIPTLQALLAPFGRKIACAFVYGSVARAEEHGASDVDLLVMGRVSLSELTPALRKAERILSREVNATTYSPEEFGGKVRRRDHFLTAVLKRPKQFLKGSERELDQLGKQ